MYLNQKEKKELYQYHQGEDYLKKSLDTSSQTNRNLLIFFLLLLLTIVSIVSKTEHIDFLLNTNIKVPLIGLEFPTFTFYVLAPLLILVTHFSVLLNLEKHLEKLTKYLKQNRKDKHTSLYPYLFNFNDSYKSKEALYYLLNIARWVVFIAFPLGTLLFIQYTFLPYRSVEMTLWHMISIFIDMLFIILFFLKVSDVLKKRLIGILSKSLFFIIAVCTISFYYTIYAKISFNNLKLVENTKLAKTKPSDEMLIYYLDKNMSEEYVWREKTEQLDLSGRDFSHAILKYIKFYNVNLNNINLSGAELWGANLSGAKLEGTKLEGANLSGAELWGANLSGAKLEGANLSGAKLEGAELWGANLSGAKLWRANLSGAELWGANLSGAELWGANLSGAELRRANLSGAKLEGANLSGAKLEGANLSGAELWRTNLSDTFINIQALKTTFFSLKSKENHLLGTIVFLKQDINISKNINISDAYIVNEKKHKINGKLPKNKNKDEFIKRKKDLACKSKTIAKQFDENTFLFESEFDFNSREYIQKNCPNILKD